MNAVRPDRSFYLALRPLEVAAYLRAHGWRESKVYPGKGALWTTDTNGEAYEVLLPYNPELGDFALRLSEVLETLALAERRPPTAVWEDLTASGADVVRAALQRPDADDGTVPLDDGVRAFDGMRDLMLAGASSAVRPRAFHPARKPNAALEYLARLRLGQTRRGSYVVTVVSRVPQDLATGNGQLFPDVEEPFDRRATATVAIALETVRQAAERAAATGRLDAFQSAIPHGVSANLCEALVHMAGDGNPATALLFDFAWSSSRLERQPLPHRVRVPADSLPIIREAGRLLRETSPQEEFVLRGLVVRLDRLEGASTGTVGVICYLDGRPRRVSVELRDADYDQAIRAHQDSQPITCTGELVREGQGLILRNPRNFSPEPLDSLF